MQRTKSKILSILLSLVMLLSLLPTTALAAAYNDVKVNGVSLGDGEYLTSNAATAASISSTEPTTYVAWYKNGVLTLNNFTGKSNSGIVLQGAPAADLIIKLIGNNTITPYDTGIQGNSAAGSITITADSGSNGKLTINMPNSEKSAFGINGSANSVTISGSAAVTIIATATATNQESYGIKSSKAVSILDSASVSITCKTPNSTSRLDSCNGIYSDTGVTINTDGTIQIDVHEAGDEAYSYGINSMGTLTLTKVGGMTVKWKKAGVQGSPLLPSSASFDPTAYDTNVTNADGTTYYIATYRPKVAATITSVSATVSQPVKGYPLDTSVNVYGATAYTADVMWKADDMTVTGNAQANTVYTALITLRAKEGETFATTLNNTTTPGGYTIQMLNSTELLLTKEFDRTNLKETTGFAIDDTTLTVAVPTAEPGKEQKAELPLTAKVNYDDGTNETVDVSWSIVTDPKPDGVDIEEDGKLTVTNKAAGGEVEVKAAYNGMTDTKTVTITKETLKPSAIVATAPAGGTNITIPNGGTNTSGQCSYKVYDQYGAVMTGISATWKMKLDPATVTGVTLTTDGAIAVTNAATTCTATVYAEGSGVKSNEITFNIARAASVPTSLTIEGSPDSVTVPTVTEPGTTKCAYGAYTAKVKDQYGAEMTGQTIEWSFTEKPGVTFNNGQLTVTNKADAGTVTITAKSGTFTETKTVNINKDTAKETFVKITAQDNEPPVTIITCTGSQRSEDYTATVYDQYGKEIQDDVNWSLDPTTYSGVNYEISATNNNIVTLKVAPNADEGTFKLVATSKTVPAAKHELEITVQKKTDVSSKINFNDGSLTYNGAGQKYEKAALDSSVTPGTGEKWTYTYAVKSTGMLDAAGLPKTVGTYTVTATYEDSNNIGSKSATLTIEPKKVNIPAVDTTEYTYDGTEKTYNIPTSPYYTVSGNKQTNAKEAGHIVTVTLADTTNTTWSDGTTGVKIYHFYIYKATPTGAPAYTKITTSGKTLNDAALTTTGGTFSVPGTVKWVDDTTGAALPDTTIVEANKLYKWVFTPSDSTNYESINGSIKLWSKSTSSGGYYYAPTAAVVPDMPMLYRGCTGDAVKTLQDKLNALGYNSGNVDGIFGAKTYAAVTAFQKANSLGVDGIVGKLTWGKIYGVSPAMPVETTTVVGRPTVSYGSRGDAVRKLQELLNALGYDCGSVDGIFGSKTKAAVLAFQKANGLGVDGIVGPLTWAKLG
jgi:peptidoglycan hydrolase-like protein with peptidoglycan-binding domain